MAQKVGNVGDVHAFAGSAEYHVTALQMPIYFNREGDHDHNGLIYALDVNLPLLKYIRALADGTDPKAYETAAKEVAIRLGMPFPTCQEKAKAPHPLVRPLVLRVNRHRTLSIRLRNEVEGRWVGLHLVGGGYDVKSSDGSEVGANGHSLAAPGGHRHYRWTCENEGVFPFHDGGSYSGGEDGTNVHGLFGALIVEPEHAIWRDPVTGRTSTEGQMDGLYLDIIPSGQEPSKVFPTSDSTLPGHKWGDPQEEHEFDKEDHREFVIFFHDEPEFLPPHNIVGRDPCLAENPLPGAGGEHGGHGAGDDHLPIMPVSYRAEPMVNRERTLWHWVQEKKHVLDPPVLNEEQHHSSWLFGDPATPILKAYIGDPVRIRFVHAGVKETHVFHLHLYEWHAVPDDKTSPRIDAISVSPQTAHTIEPAWGAGNRHQVAGDVIWHCHLYPHFHEGMWGMFRTFETLQKGAEEKVESPLIADPDPVYQGRRLDHYPDGTPIERLWPLPGRVPPAPTPEHPGYPLYIPGRTQQKSPVPPWPLEYEALPANYDYRPNPTELEKGAFNDRPVPGEMFTRRPFSEGQSVEWPENVPSQYSGNGDREVAHDIAVTLTPIHYNGHGWHDKHGHLYYRTADGEPAEGGVKQPLFFRAQHGQILNLTLKNDLPLEIPKTEFDHAFPPCEERPWEGECALHVHMVKFDPICADGASVGWNYLSGPVAGKKMIYRWWLDQEFGTIFFHDHLFANYRQKHGLFGALIVEPPGAEFYHPTEDKKIVSGMQARIRVPGRAPEWFREFCVGIGDFIPMWDRDGNPLNPPEHPGGHGDQGVMGLNYRSDPIHERLRTASPPAEMVDPALWFSSREPYNRDPYTVRFNTFAGDPIWFRLVQGSHEEQHSFQIHGMRWQRFRVNPDSAIRNQQTFGLSEAFTFIQNEPYLPGDYLYKLSSADDLWLGCWGLIRAYQTTDGDDKTGGLRKLGNPPVAALPNPALIREFHVRAERRRIVYRDPDLVDPFGLVYQLERIIGPDGIEIPVRQPRSENPAVPLVLRCREGETVRVRLTNGLPPGTKLRPEPFAPRVPVEERNPFSNRPERPVSSQVSMHADLLRYDVTKSDGANVGRNVDASPQSAAPGGPAVVYEWHTDRPPPSAENPNPNGGEPLGPLLLQDMADFRNHRHHGLIGALIVEPKDATPLWVRPGQQTATGKQEAWDGPRATLVVNGEHGKERIEEVVLLLQDGLRHYLRGNIHMPIADEPPGAGEDEPDHEDQGQKGFNYRSEPVGPDIQRILQGKTEGWLSNPHPATPVFRVPKRSTVRLHLIGATDKPRNQSFTVHGVTWPEYRFLGQKKGPFVASEAAITTGTARTFEFKVHGAGDYAYRSGILKWAVPQGLWGILRVGKSTTASSVLSKTTEAVRQQPMASLSIAGAVGWMFGLLAKRRR
ncbi:multicopper oxidase domain-containing protein [Belnapia moabensis]|uniref:multicopper oxidase domain-containing protein n=1 Tax=Belnapia moabensis TaxID=365533 RepID=UPI000AC34BEE|nr:multicopper oxidase domain-containing protein [Belnapia moabensis]